MRNRIKALLPQKEQSIYWFSVVFTIAVAGLMTIWGIYGMGRYGMALFILTPLFIGFCPALLIGLKNGITKKKHEKLDF